MSEPRAKEPGAAWRKVASIRTGGTWLSDDILVVSTPGIAAVTANVIYLDLERCKRNLSAFAGSVLGRKLTIVEVEPLRRIQAHAKALKRKVES